MKWFLENTKPEWRSMSFDSTALFYTQGLSEKAKQFARQAINNKITIWVSHGDLSTHSQSRNICLFTVADHLFHRMFGHARIISS
jgi:hypothetical protein